LAVELGTRSPRVRVDCILPGPVLFPPDMPEPERAEAIRFWRPEREEAESHVQTANVDA
jgi:pteridine reductase